MDFNDVIDTAEKNARDLQPWQDYFKLRAKEMEALFALYKPCAYGRALDIGAGMGFNAFMLDRLYGETFCADLYSKDVKTHSLGIDRAKAFFQKLPGKNVKIMSCDSRYLPFKDGYFDTVYMIYTLEHIRERETALKEIERVLRPKGEAVIVVPSFAERFFYPLSFYREIFRKAKLHLGPKAGTGSPVSGSDPADEAGGLGRRFSALYPHFPFPEPHGEYPDYFCELVMCMPFAWTALAKKIFKIKNMFSTMLFPKELSSFFLGDKALPAYIKTLKFNERYGRNKVLRLLGQNLCLVLEKKNG